MIQNSHTTIFHIRETSKFFFPFSILYCYFFLKVQWILLWWKETWKFWSFWTNQLIHQTTIKSSQGSVIQGAISKWLEPDIITTAHLALKKSGDWTWAVVTGDFTKKNFFENFLFAIIWFHEFTGKATMLWLKMSPENLLTSKMWILQGSNM